MVLGGDGRWFNKEAAQIIIKLAAGNGVKKMFVGRNGYLCTPAASAVIRARKAFGGFIMSAIRRTETEVAYPSGGGAGC